MRFLLAVLVLLATAVGADAASLLPPGKNCFFDANGDPLTGGTVQFYVINTTTPKSTWKDSAESILNTNPVVLDSAGCSVIYGKGVYRQVLKDQLGNLIWDQPVADPGSTGISFGGSAGGDGNNVIITAPGFSFISGQMVSYLATATNSGPMTITVNGVAVPLVKDTVSGPSPMVGGEITAGNVVNAVYMSADGKFHLVALPAATAGPTAVVPVAPGGRLTLLQGNPVMSGNVTTVGVIYYTPFVGSTLPIWTGNLFQPVTFAETALDIDPNHHLANQTYDLFMINDNGTPRLCSGPAWSGNSRVAIGSIGYLFGILVNVGGSMTCRWGPVEANTVLVPPFQATYVGTFRTDTTAGETSWTPNPDPSPTGGPSPAEAELYVWNNYNRIGVKSLVFDNSPAYQLPALTQNSRMANGSANNRIAYVSGGLTDVVVVIFKHRVRTPAVAGTHCYNGLFVDVTSGTVPVGVGSNYYNAIFTELEDASGTVATGADEITNVLDASIGFHFVQMAESGVVPSGTTKCTYIPSGVLQAILRM